MTTRPEMIELPPNWLDQITDLAHDGPQQNRLHDLILSWRREPPSGDVVQRVAARIHLAAFGNKAFGEGWPESEAAANDLAESEGAENEPNLRLDGQAVGALRSQHLTVYVDERDGRGWQVYEHLDLSELAAIEEPS
jgi:hypothetical protein